MLYERNGYTMADHRSGNFSITRRLAALVAVAVLAVLAISVQPSAADHGLPHPEALTRGTFLDAVSAQLKVKQDGRGTRVMNVQNASDVVMLKITIHDGAIAPWHAHWGPGILINAGPGTLTSVLSDDCVPRQVGPGKAVVDPGGNVLHAAVNNSGQDLVLYAFFLGVEGGPVLPAEPPADCDPFLGNLI
jgi:quercetin dioxygenase-like cupin family protein